jgi:hypothetical protein
MAIFKKKKNWGAWVEIKKRTGTLLIGGNVGKFLSISKSHRGKSRCIAAAEITLVRKSACFV